MTMNNGEPGTGDSSEALSAALQDLFRPQAVSVPDAVNQAMGEVIQRRGRQIRRARQRGRRITFISFAMAASLLLCAGWFLVVDEVVPTPIPRGDLTGDRIVDIADAYRMRQLLADAAETRPHLDLNASGQADGEDLDWLFQRIVAVHSGGMQ
ncbi:MAG: hypothetical protein ACYTGH_00160 [Planctomycetota bacterium]|jgi:hypothetical protein